MEFTGRVFFDIAGADTWHFYKMVAAGVHAGATVRIDWQPVAGPETSAGELRAMRAIVWAKRHHTEQHGLFLQALLILHHQEGRDLDEAALREAAVAASLDPRVLDAGIDLEDVDRDLDAARDEAQRLGVRLLPSIFRHGPVLHLKTNGAATRGDVLARLETINRVLDDDGLWELSKP